MRTIIKRPATGGIVKAIPSKSVAHRLLICAYLSGLDAAGESGTASRDMSSIFEGMSQDVDATLRCLKALKAGEPDEDGFVLLDCGESGSTLRFMLPVCTAIGGKYRLTGSGRLLSRPMKDLEDQLEEHGCSIVHEESAIKVSGALGSGEYVIPGNISSQYVTGLLIALPLLEGDSVLKVKGELQSGPYVDLTIDALEKSGISIDVIRYPDIGDHLKPSEEKRECVKGPEKDVSVEYRINGGQKYRLKSLGMNDIEGDWSNGAFWLVAEALGADIECMGLDKDSRQGDRAIEEIISVCKSDETVIVDVKDTPDLVPAISILASGRKKDAITKIVNVSRLRSKESDRIDSVVTTLKSIGAKVEGSDDEICITGTNGLKGGKVDSFNDHRIVMMAAVGAIICTEPVEINGSEAVRKSYPDFFEDYTALGGEIEHYDK